MGEFERLIEKYMEIVSKVISFIPYSRMNVWKEFFLNPTKVISANIDPVSQRIVDLYFVVAIGFLVYLVLSVPLFLISLISFNVIEVIFGVLYYFVILLLSPLLYLLYSLLEYIIAKILGGKANFTAHFNASALPHLSVFAVLLPLIILIIPLGWLALIPVLSCCAAIILLPIEIILFLVLLYALFLKFLAFKEVHKFSDVRAAATVILPIIIVFLTIFLIVVLFASAITLASLSLLSR